MGETLTKKAWGAHVMRAVGDEPDLLYIDLHLVHEVTSSQAFEGLQMNDQRAHRPDLTLATENHNTPTLNILAPIADPVSRTQVGTLRRNAAEFGIHIHPLGDRDQGVVHIIDPQPGATQPGMTIVYGGSHTSIHGVFGALAFEIDTSEVEHVLATQTLPQKKPRMTAVNVNGDLPPGITTKGVVLTLIAKVDTGGDQGYIVEYRGSTIEQLPMKGRMTIYNVSIEWGAKADMIAPDEATLAYLKGRPHAPKGGDWEAAVGYWRTLRSGDDAHFDAQVDIDATRLTSFVTWGTNPGHGVPLGEVVPAPKDFDSEVERATAHRALEYMDLAPGTPMREVAVDTVFLGSCTNGRIGDPRLAASVLRRRRIAEGVRILVIPGSAWVRLRAELEGLDKIFLASGAEWRVAGYSICLGMNPDQPSPEERSASTSNRNFEGRQGKGGHTHLVSPTVTATTAVTSHLVALTNLVGI